MIGASVRRRRAAVAVGCALLVAACGPATPTPSPSATVAPSPPGPPPEPTTGSSASASAGPLSIDASLLDLLPSTVAGLALTGSLETAAESVGDPDLARDARAIAVGVVVDPATENFAVASVVALRPDVYDEEFFRSWRDSFDQGVCAQAGGVEGNAVADIDGRTVYIGTCSGGAHTYHVYLEEPNVVVSVNSVGEARLGEELIETLPE